jgi:hypothetical protein
MNSQARIMPSAMAKTAHVPADEIVTFLIRLGDLLLTEDEKATLTTLGTVYLYESARLALVKLPARRLLELSEVPGIIRIE